MASVGKVKRWDPGEDGPRVFDRHPARLAMAVACRDRTLEGTELAAASGQSDANARKSAATLRERGVLKPVPTGGKPGVRLAEEWRGPVDEAELRARKGRLESEQTLLLVLRTSVAPFYMLTADREGADHRFAWVARLPHHSRFGLIVLINPSLEEDAIERLGIELEQNGVEHERLALGRMAGHAELREFAAGSLPGAFGPSK